MYDVRCTICKVEILGLLAHLFSSCILSFVYRVTLNIMNKY